MKICRKCKSSKPISSFHRLKRSKDGYDNICKQCKSDYDKAYYAKRYSVAQHSERRRALKQDIAIRNRQFIYNYLSTHPCVGCGESDPIVLEFDHLDGADKRFNVSDCSDRSISTIEDEISKCRVLCANCHRRRTAVQLDWYKDIL